MRTKLSFVIEAMNAGDWREALRLAAKFPQLGEQAKAIRDGNEAFVRPDFYRQIHKDPAALIEAGKAALIARYSASPPSA